MHKKPTRIGRFDPRGLTSSDRIWTNNSQASPLAQTGRFAPGERPANNFFFGFVKSQSQTDQTSSRVKDNSSRVKDNSSRVKVTSFRVKDSSSRLSGPALVNRGQLLILDSAGNSRLLYRF